MVIESRTSLKGVTSLNNVMMMHRMQHVDSFHALLKSIGSKNDMIGLVGPLDSEDAPFEVWAVNFDFIQRRSNCFMSQVHDDDKK